MTTHLDGRALLRAFLQQHGVSQVSASKALGVSDPTIHDWLAGIKRPRAHHRESIAVWTGGDVPASSWLLDAERDAMSNVSPFSPAIDADASAGADK